MNTKKTFTAVFSAAAVFISAAVIVRLPAAEPGQADRLPSVAGPDALRRELWLVQAEALPARSAVVVDAGHRVYTAEEGEDAAALAEGLVPVESADGVPCWPVTVFEDADTRETVFLNADGGEAGRLPPLPEYDPSWALAAAFPDGVPPDADTEGFDPAAVAMIVWLSLPEYRNAPAGDGPGAPTADGVADGAKDGAAWGLVPAGQGQTERQTTAADGADIHESRAAAVGAPTNTTTAVPGYRSPPVRCAAVFVDGYSGNDAWSGRSRIASKGDGPKRTIRAGLAESTGGQSLVVCGGQYRENIDVRGRRARVRIVGDVTLLRRTAAPPAPPARSSVPETFSPTGTVARVGGSQ